MTEDRRPAFSIGLGEVTGAVADLGVLVPLAAALILVNGLEPGAVMLGAGVLVLLAGVAFRVPFPVQPLKALTAVAVAGRLSPAVINAAGIEIAAFLLLVSVGRVADLVARLFTKPTVRALQLGVGLLLVVAAARLVLEPPEVFRGTPPSPWPVVLAISSGVLVAWAARRRRFAVALLALGAGTAFAVVLARPELAGPAFSLPDVRLPPAGAFGAAFVLLVIPQLPLTFGNAVVAVSDLAHEYFGPAARRVTPSAVCISCGVGNVVSGAIGGMPMCHGASGLTAHVRLGARTAGMNLLLGAAFIVGALFFARDVPALLGLLPVWALAAFLVYAGARHALLVADLRGPALAVALLAGAAGAALGNLAVTLALGLAGDGAIRVASRRGERGAEGDATGGRARAVPARIPPARTGPETPRRSPPPPTARGSSPS